MALLIFFSSFWKFNIIKTVERVEIESRLLQVCKTWNDDKQGRKLRAQPVSAMRESH